MSDVEREQQQEVSLSTVCAYQERLSNMLGSALSGYTAQRVAPTNAIPCRLRRFPHKITTTQNEEVQG